MLNITEHEKRTAYLLHSVALVIILQGKSLFFNGGADRDRTDDLLNAIHFQALTGVIQWQTVLDTI